MRLLRTFLLLCLLLFAMSVPMKFSYNSSACPRSLVCPRVMSPVTGVARKAFFVFLILQISQFYSESQNMAEVRY